MVTDGCRQGEAGVVTGLTELGSLRLSVMWVNYALAYSSLLVRIITPPELESKIISLSFLSLKMFCEQGQNAH